MKLEQVGEVWVLSHDSKTLQLNGHEAMRLRTSNGAQRKGFLWKTVMPRLEGTRPDRKQLAEGEQRLRGWLGEKNMDWSGIYPVAAALKTPVAPGAPVVQNAAPVIAPKAFVQPS